MSKNFPGNPYARDTVSGVSSDGVAVARAVLLLAFEQRTANILAAAEPKDYSGVPIPVVNDVMRTRKEAFERLGLPTVPPKVESGHDPDLPHITITLPEDPNLDGAGRKDLMDRILASVESEQGVYPVKVSSR